MENFNYYTSPKTAEKNNKIQKSATEFIEKIKSDTINEQAAQNEKAISDMMSGAKFSNASSFVRSRERARILQESLEYRDSSTKAIMSKYIQSIVEAAFPFDINEYSKMNPNYKEETAQLIEEMLDHSELEENIKNKKTLRLMEHISRNLPDVKTGICLKEEDIVSMVTKAENAEVEKTLKDLSGDIEAKVAELVQKEQEKKEEIQDNFDRIVSIAEPALAESYIGDVLDGYINLTESFDILTESSEEKSAVKNKIKTVKKRIKWLKGNSKTLSKDKESAPKKGDSSKVDKWVMENKEKIERLKKRLDILVAQKRNVKSVVNESEVELLADMLDEEIIMSNFSAILEAEAVPRMKTKDSELEELEIPDDIEAALNTDKVAKKENPKNVEEIPTDETETDPVETGANTTEIEVAKDGKIKIKIIKENLIVEEVPKNGLLETLAINEGLKMVENGAPYNGDLALARALNSITVLEAFNTLGLINFNRDAQSRVVAAGGGIIL